MAAALVTHSTAHAIDDEAALAATLSVRERELEAVRDITHAFLNATRPVEVYRLALARVTPLVRASFGSIFLRDEQDATLLRLACAQNWPQASARYLGQLRIRVGRGPTGRAVADGVAVEVEDLFADPTLREWWEPARELGFGALIALPLKVRGQVAGALSFYFQSPHVFEEDERRLLALVADQLSATVEKAHLIEDLAAANELLQHQNDELAERVREAEEGRRLKTEFLANITHELRTPLTSILGYTHLLSNGHITDRAQHQNALDKIERSATALLGLINDLLDLSQLKLGRATMAVGEEQGVELARRAIEACGPVPHGVRLDLHAPDGAAPIETDGAKVTKILENLISNAYKFTVEGAVTLTVCVETEADASSSRVVWEVRDTGVGIRSEELEAVFDEFRQVDGSSTRLYGGTGLGLALSQRLAGLLGGEVRAQSEPGRGSIFSLRLPLKPPLEALAR